MQYAPTMISFFKRRIFFVNTNRCFLIYRCSVVHIFRSKKRINIYQDQKGSRIKIGSGSEKDHPRNLPNYRTGGTSSEIYYRSQERIQIRLKNGDPRRVTFVDDVKLAVVSNPKNARPVKPSSVSAPSAKDGARSGKKSV